MRRQRPPTLQEAHDAELERFRGDLRPWDVKLMAKAKRWMRILSVIGGVMGAGGTVVGGVVKVWRVLRAGSVAPPELPATGQPTVATDRVDKPHLPRK